MTGKWLSSGLALLMAAAAAPPAKAVDASEVAAAERAFAADGLAIGIKRSFLKWSAPQAIVFHPDPVLAQQVYAAEPDLAPGERDALAWWPLWAGISSSGDLGFTTGPVEIDGRRTHSHYFTIWQRQADGGWKWIYDGGGGGDGANEPGPGGAVSYLAATGYGSSSPGAALAEVRSAETALSGLARADQKAAMLQWLAADAHVHAPGLPPARTPAARAEALSSRPGAIEFAQLGGVASKAGDLVWTYGRASWKRAGEQDQGHYVRVWQKRTGGWKLVYDQIVAPPPPAAPAPG